MKPLHIFATLSLLLLPISLTAAPLAFPGAEGFGALATGGRGGQIIHVTNLNDSGPGSFRDAVSHGGRTVVFDVAGYIELKGNLSVASDLTIAGQTAPGDGISTKNFEVSFSRAHNVIVRYMHFRQGLTPGQQKKYSVSLDGCSNIILDHCSIQFGRWDCIGTNKSSAITVQYSIIGPGVAPQRFGCLCESDNITFSHDLWISNQSRNPKSKGVVQYINNIIYNWGVCGYVGGHSGGAHGADLIGNYFIKGPNSSNNFAGEFKPTDHIFQQDNYLDLNRDGALSGRPITADDFGHGPNTPTLLPAASVIPPVPVTRDTATVAFQKVAATAGCSLQRDSVDATLIADLNSLGKSGKIISDPAEMGGFGTLKTGPAKILTTPNPIPPTWYQSHPFAPRDPNTPYPNTPYTTLETFLNDLAGAPPAQ
jgi:hypothetical protein